jgi:hypothetical protein
MSSLLLYIDYVQHSILSRSRCRYSGRLWWPNLAFFLASMGGGDSVDCGMRSFIPIGELFDISIRNIPESNDSTGTLQYLFMYIEGPHNEIFIVLLKKSLNSSYNSHVSIFHRSLFFFILS